MEPSLLIPERYQKKMIPDPHWYQCPQPVWFISIIAYNILGLSSCHLTPLFPWCFEKLANALEILQMRNYSKEWKRCSITLLKSSSAVGCRKHNMSLENCPSFSNPLDIPAPCITKRHDQTQMLMFESS